MKVLIAGLGGIGQRHIRNLRTILGPQVQITAYDVRRLMPVVTADLQIKTGSNVEDEYGIQVVDDLETALNREPDAVLVCNPSSRHMEVALAAAQAGAHLFIEKPLSNSYYGVKELIELVQRQRLVSLVGYQMRFHPLLQRLRALLQQNAVGQILAVRAEVGEYMPGWHKYEDYRKIYASRRELGGGVILSQIHELDYLYWLFAFPRRIFALGGHLSRLEIDVEDTADILMECEMQGQRVPVHVHLDYLQQPPSRTCHVIGDAGQILLDLRLASLSLFDGSGNLAERKSFASFERNQLFLDEMSHFLACLRNDDSPQVPVHVGAQSLRMALAAKESMATGKAIDMEEWLP